LGHPGRGKNHHNSKEYNERRIAGYLEEISPANRAFARQLDQLKVGQGVRSGSREGLWRALRLFDAHCHGKAWAEVDAQDASSFMAHLTTELRYSLSHRTSTANWVKHVLRASRPSGELPFLLRLAFRTRGNRRLPERPVLKPEEERTLMGAAPTMRDQVLMGLLIEGGYRVNEVVNLDVGGVQFDDEGGCWVQMRDLEEGNKTGARREYLVKYAPLLRAWFELRAQDLGRKSLPDEPDDPVICTFGGRARIPRWKNRLTKIGAWQAVNRIQRATGIRHFRLHDFRHGAITRAVEAGVDLVEVSMRFWGIPHSKELGRYVHASDEHRERMARRANGIDEDGQSVAFGRKRCPCCAEEIRAEATKCRHCGEFLKGEPRPA
jgi:integrase